jgi:uncharacterized protein (DUF1810 family)
MVCPLRQCSGQLSEIRYDKIRLMRYCDLLSEYVWFLAAASFGRPRNEHSLDRTPCFYLLAYRNAAANWPLKLAARSRLAALEGTVTEADLIHFVTAQSDVYDQVTEELTEGRKRTHWMWIIFPQLAGLGHSRMARRYAIRDLDHAKRYLADPLLGSRLCQHVHLMMGHKGKSALDILGSPDDLKLRSCLTLFAEAASDDSDRLLFKQALDQFYGGMADPRTVELLR